jgi:hypothetical protein
VANRAKPRDLKGSPIIAAARNWTAHDYNANQIIICNRA